MPIRKVDANQPEIVAALRQAGAKILHLHELGHGAPDILIGYQERLYLAEIKDGSKPKSRRQLTPDEIRFHQEWPGYVAIIESIDDGLRLIGAIE